MVNLATIIILVVLSVLSALLVNFSNQVTDNREQKKALAPKC